MFLFFVFRLLEGGGSNFCNLQKVGLYHSDFVGDYHGMYFSSFLRGMGFLYALLKRCLSFVLDVVATLLFVVFQDAKL